MRVNGGAAGKSISRRVTAAGTAFCVLFSVTASSWAEAGLWEDRRLARARHTQPSSASAGARFSLPAFEAVDASQIVTRSYPGDAGKEPLLRPLRGSSLLNALPLEHTTVRDAYLPDGGFSRL